MKKITLLLVLVISCIVCHAQFPSSREDLHRKFDTSHNLISYEASPEGFRKMRFYMSLGSWHMEWAMTQKLTGDKAQYHYDLAQYYWVLADEAIQPYLNPSKSSPAAK